MRLTTAVCLAIALAALSVFGLGCGMLPEGQAPPATHAVRGILLEVDAVSVQRLNGFRLRTDDGAVFDFEADPDFLTAGTHPMSPGHLRQHMALAEPITVVYRVDGERLVALSATD